MAKSIIKELIIVLLLLLAMMLVLGIFLYDYIPTNKIVPKVEQYQVPNNIKEELNESVNSIEDEQTKIVYEIDGTDLNNYEKTKDYQKGKVNPFSQDIMQSNNSNAQTSNNNTNSNNNASNNNTGSNKDARR